jgi:hypothetical protein
MRLFGALRREQFEFPCTVEIENTPRSLHAHVEIAGGFVAEPGDEVQVKNAPTQAPYGDRIKVRRTAVVTRASALERAWTRFLGNFELTELYDVSFTERRRL